MREDILLSPFLLLLLWVADEGARGDKPQDSERPGARRERKKECSNLVLFANAASASPDKEMDELLLLEAEEGGVVLSPIEHNAAKHAESNRKTDAAHASNSARLTRREEL